MKEVILVEPISEVLQETPCKVFIAKVQCFNTFYKQIVINDFPFLILFQPPTNIESNVCHVIKTNGQPIRCEVHKLSPEMIKITKEEIDKLFDAKT